MHLGVASAKNKGGVTRKVAPPQVVRLFGVTAARRHLGRMLQLIAHGSQLSRAAFVEPGKFTTSV